MAYLDEAGLAALVGKVKGQMVELTAEEYAQIDPAKKNYDNKLYFVKDEAYAYPIDNEPTANSDFLVKSGGVYNWTSKIGSGALTTTAKTIIPAVNEVNAKVIGLNSNSTYNWTSYLSSDEQGGYALANAMVTHNIVVLSIRTNSIVHNQDKVIMTIPEGFRPIAYTHAIGKVGTHEICTVSVTTNGQVSIWSMNASPDAARFVCQVVYVYR